MTENGIEIARTLDDAYRVCDPDKPLAADDVRFVDLSELRGIKVISKSIARKISRCDQNSYHQQLLTGHRGCGKSTELFRLKAELEKQKFYVIYFDAEDQLDLGNLDYLDVLLCMAKEIERQLRESDYALNQSLLEDLAAWFSDHIIEKENNQTAQASLKTTVSTGAGIPFLAELLANFTSQIKMGSSTRSTTRQNLKRDLPQFINQLNLLIINARDKVMAHDQHRDLVLLVDGLEKTPYEIRSDNKSTHEHLFVLHAEQLKAPQCHIIYTMPISLAYNANLGDVFDHQVIPMVKTTAEGIDKLCEVVAKRLDVTTLFEDPTLLREIASLSGGVMRDLMRLIRFATDTDAQKITTVEVEDAKNTLVREYDRLVRNEEMDAMRWVNDHHRVQGDKPYARMLFLRIILEYQNGERSADLHPAVKKIPWLSRALQAAANE